VKCLKIGQFLTKLRHKKQSVSVFLGATLYIYIYIYTVTTLLSYRQTPWRHLVQFSREKYGGKIQILLTAGGGATLKKQSPLKSTSTSSRKECTNFETFPQGSIFCTI